MKVAYVINKKIVSIAVSAVKPEGKDWVVLADDFKGRVGDTVSSDGTVVYAADDITADDAIKSVQEAEQSFVAAEELYRKATERFSLAEDAMRAAVRQAADATNERNAAYAAFVEAERRFKSGSQTILEKKEVAKRVVDRAVERAGEEAALKAKEEAKKKARKELESPNKKEVKEKG